MRLGLLLFGIGDFVLVMVADAGRIGAGNRGFFGSVAPVYGG